MRKHTFEYVQGRFTKEDCELLEDSYVNSYTKMEYRCSCGNISEISFANFRRGQKCKECGIKKIKEKKKLTFNYVQGCFTKEDCELLENSYINNHTKMRYKCSCGNISEITFHNFRAGNRCKKCGYKKAGEKQKLSFEYVCNCFAKEGCELLEEKYINCYTKMKYRCSCGNISKVSFSHFRRGDRCKKCVKERRKQSMIKKYGVPSFFKCGYSKESQILFDAIYKKINKKYKNKTYYATLNKEFAIDYKGNCFIYDFVNSKFKKVIEYNGESFHPQKDEKDEEIGWCLFHPNKTVKEARNYEKIKYEGLEKRGYKILTVWDHELHKDLNVLVKKCLDFLMS